MPVDMLASSTALLLAATAAVISCGLNVLLYPLLARYALARPNARSSHRSPTPQGGGIAVIAAVVIVLAASAVMVPFTHPYSIAIVLACAIALAVVGAIDDIRPIDPVPRLLLQSMAVIVVLASLPEGLHTVPFLPWWLERTLLFVAMLWFLNVVNFMDGIDWITVAEVVPITAALSWFGTIGALPRDAALVALALCGATAGFAPFNRPVARLFLGDVGSLPIGLLLGWLLVLLGEHHFAAALLLPLYYVADATITMLRRFARGEAVMQAHRSHYYQQAFDGGLGIYVIVGRVFLANLILAGLAASCIFTTSPAIQTMALAAGCLVVAVLLWSLAAKPQTQSKGP